MKAEGNCQQHMHVIKKYQGCLSDGRKWHQMENLIYKKERSLNNNKIFLS